MSILSSFYNKMFGPAQPVSNFYEKDRYKHYFGSNEFKLIASNPIPDAVLTTLTQPKELKALIPRKVGLWKTADTAKFFAQPVTVPAALVVNTIDDVFGFVTRPFGSFRPVAATGNGVAWLGSLPFRTAIAAGKVWNNYAPNEWAFDGSWVKPLIPNALSYSPAGDEALAKKIAMHDTLKENFEQRQIQFTVLINPQNPYDEEVIDLKNLEAGDIEGYNKHLRKAYGDERIGLLFRRAQAHLLRTARFEVRDDYASQSGIKDKTKMEGFQKNFNAQLEHLPKAIESASAAIDELLKAFSGREADFLNEIAALKEKLEEEEARMPSLDTLVDRLLSIPEVTESLSLHQAVLALPRKVNNSEQLYLAIQGLSKVMAALRQQKTEDNAEAINLTEADICNLEQLWPVYNHLKEALNAYEEISKVGKDLRGARKDLLGVPEGYKDTFEKHPKTLLALVRAFETLKEVENLPADMKGFAEYFVSTLKESIHIRAVASTELARILHYGLEVNPMDIPGLYTDMQSKAMTRSDSLSFEHQEQLYGYQLSGMPLGTVFKPHDFPAAAEDALQELVKEFAELANTKMEFLDSITTSSAAAAATAAAGGGGGVSFSRDRLDPKTAYRTMADKVRMLQTNLSGLMRKEMSRDDLLRAVGDLFVKLEDEIKAFSKYQVTRSIRDAAASSNQQPALVQTQEQIKKILKAWENTCDQMKDQLIPYIKEVYEPSKEKRVRISKMLKEMKEKAKKELAESPYKAPEEFLFRAALDFRLLELFLDLGSKEKDKRIKDLKKTFDLMAPVWTVGIDPEEAIENNVQEELWKNSQNFLKQIVPGMKRGDALAAEMIVMKGSVPCQLKNALELLENICSSEKGMNLIVACLDEKNPKRHHAYGNLFFRGVGIGQYIGDVAGKNESSLKRYRQSLDFYAKAVDEALAYRVGFDENPLVTGDDVNTFRHAAKKAGYFLQAAEAMVRFENLLKNAADYLNTEGPAKSDRETWTLFVEKLLRRLNAAIAAEEKMTGVVIAEHWLFQDYAQGPAARNEDGTIAPQDGLDARASASLARKLARKGVFGVLDPEVEEMVRNIPPRGQSQSRGYGSGSTFQSMMDPHGGLGGGADPKRDYAQENRSAQVDYLRPAVRMAGHAKNPSNLLMLYRVKAMLLDAVRRPEDADAARRNALQRKEEGIVDKNDFFFDEKKFQALYEQFGGLEEKESQLAL